MFDLERFDKILIWGFIFIVILAIIFGIGIGAMLCSL